MMQPYDAHEAGMIEMALAQNFGADRLCVAAPGLHGRVSSGDFGVAQTRDTLVAPFLALDYVAHESWAWNNYKCTIKALAAKCVERNGGRAVRVLEIGGGRDPLFSFDEIKAANLDFTVNDIDAGELALAPAGYRTQHFDIAGNLTREQVADGQYDIIVSQMVFEHILDVRKAWSNCHALLAPEGVALAFFPTLFAPPYVLNYCMPEFVSAAVLRLFFPQRTKIVQPKFPAHYNYCRGDQDKLTPLFRDLGFSTHLVVPFWSHGYFRHLPVLREIDAWIQNLARKRDWRFITTYAYALARK